MTETGRSPWLSDLAFYVNDPVTENDNRAKAAEAAVNNFVQQHGGPGFRLDRDHAEKMVEQAIQVRRSLENDQSITQSLERMKPAADDPVSVEFTKAATWNGGQPGAFAYGAGHVRLEILYLDELIQRLNEALGRTAATDQANHEALKGVEEGAI